MSGKVEPISVSKILVASDGSEYSRKAVDWAVDLAKKWNASIYLIHVLEEKKIPKGLKEFAETEKLNVGEYFRMVCDINQFFGKAEAGIKKAGIKVEQICVEGDPAEEIINTAKRKQIDLIVIGSRGLGRFSKAVMGSVSTKVCNHAPCTCITVK